MVKNINTFHLTEKIRLGRHTSESQPENTIVLNAGDAEIQNLETSGFYVSPMRYGTSNVLMYSPESKEIVFGNRLSLQSITELGSSSNVKTYFKHLEVDQLDIMNVTAINTYYIENPEFIIGDSNTDTLERATLKMVKGSDQVSLDYDGHLNIHSHSKSPLGVTVHGALYTNTCTSQVFLGDGGLLSNVTYEQLGYVIPRMRITEDVHAQKYHGDGSLLTGLQIEQIGNITSNNLTVASVTTKGNVYIGSNLNIDGIVRAARSIIAYEFIGDGRRLSGLAHDSNLKSNVTRIENLETLCVDIAKIHDVKPLASSCVSLKESLDELRSKVLKTEEFGPRFSKLEYIPNVINSHTQQISTLFSDTQKVSAYIPIMIQTDSDVRKLNTYVPVIDGTLRRVIRLEENQPRLDTLEKTTVHLEAQVPRFKPLEALVPVVKRIEPYVARVESLESLVPKVTRIEPYIPRIEALEPKVARLEPAVKALEVLPPRVKLLEEQVPRISNLETHIPRFVPLEALISNVYATEVIANQVPSIDKRLGCVEAKFPISLQDIMSYTSNTVTTLHLENTKTALTTSGNIGVGTTEPTARISIYSEPNIVSEIGEVNGIKINELVQINAYIKGNNGTTSGRPGGVVFKTKRPNGVLENSMVLDGNGCMTVGSSTAHPSAALAVDSTTRGMLLPRVILTSIQKPEPGLMVYDTETDSFWGYKTSGWTKFC